MLDKSGRRLGSRVRGETKLPTSFRRRYDKVGANRGRIGITALKARKD